MCSENNEIKLLILDVDGTLTDGKIHMGPNGETHKSFSVKDGMGIKLLQKQGVVIAIVTARNSIIVENRAKELGIEELYQSISNKVSVITSLAEKYNVSLANIAYIGDDINDVEVMKIVGHSFCPNDSTPIVTEIANTVLTKNGGDGAVREATEIIMNGLK